MATNLVPWIAGATIVGGVVYLAAKKLAEGKAPGKSTACAAAQGFAGIWIGESAQSLPCGPVDTFLDMFKSDAAKNAENIRLNGEIRVPLDEGVKNLVRCRSIDLTKTAPLAGVNGGTNMTGDLNDLLGPALPMLKGTVVEFKNGCQPFDGAPGRGKCAPGTFSMRAANTPHSPAVPKSGCNYQQKEIGSLDEQRPRIELLMTGQLGDPTTHGRTTPAYAKGVALACNEFELPYRAGADSAPYCRRVSTQTSHTATGGTQSDGAPGVKAGYHWVVDHWERD